MEIHLQYLDSDQPNVPKIFSSFSWMPRAKYKKNVFHYCRALALSFSVVLADSIVHFVMDWFWENSDCRRHSTGPLHRNGREKKIDKICTFGNHRSGREHGEWLFTSSSSHSGIELNENFPIKIHVFIDWIERRGTSHPVDAAKGTDYKRK